MVSVLRVHLPSEIPIVGCELTPYVLMRRPSNSVSHEDVPESAPLNGQFLRYKWYRIQSDKKGFICSIHPSEEATLQCVGCVKAKIPVAKSYHCTPKCFCDAWQHHRAMHERATSGLNEEMPEIISASMANSASPVYHAQRNAGETWFEVGRAKSYTPTAADSGHVLKFECVVVDVETKLAVGLVNSILTSKVIPAPTPRPRKLISVSGADVNVRFDPESRVSSSGTFTVLSYNILSDLYATSELYSYCPPWALAWSYRRQNLLREIVGYRADIVCLQEVQINHFEDFFAPELDKHGYQAIFLKKSQDVSTGNVQAIDGIAIIFRRDRFSQFKKYEVEFNKTAQSLTEVLPSGQKKTAQERILKGNVALIVVLEAKFSTQGVDNTGTGQLVCVANTHINTQQNLKDVKIWQVHTLIKGLEKIAERADIPMLVCGDFSSVPGSAPHALLAIGKIDPKHPDLSPDPFGILNPSSKLAHQLPLVSAYSSFARVGGPGLALEQYRTRMNPTTNEPLFTNYTRDFIGTVDYMFYSADTLSVESLLELLDEDSLRKDTALPSPEWSSDHIALLAEFRCRPKNRR